MDSTSGGSTRKLLERCSKTWKKRLRWVLDKQHTYVQQNLSINDTLNIGHLSNKNTVCSPNHVELCTNLPLK